MEKQIRIKGRVIEYRLNSNSRTRRLRLSVYADGRIVLSKPRYVSARLAERMIKERGAWVIEKLESLQKKERLFPLGNYKADKENARELIKARLEHFSGVYGFVYQRISIRDQRTRWGSCSKAGNLNFNYRLLHLPSNLRDYIIVHEMCHLREFNHSKEFWRLVAKTIPDYLKLRKELRGMGM